MILQDPPSPILDELHNETEPRVQSLRYRLVTILPQDPGSAHRLALVEAINVSQSIGSHKLIDANFLPHSWRENINFQDQETHFEDLPQIEFEITIRRVERKGH